VATDELSDGSTLAPSCRCRRLITLAGAVPATNVRTDRCLGRRRPRGILSGLNTGASLLASAATDIHPMDLDTQRRFYDEAHLHNELRFPMQDYPEFVRRLKIAPDARVDVLDVCSGQGFFFEALNRLVPTATMTGVDFSSTARAKAASRVPAARFVDVDVETFNLETQFDYIVNLGSLEHLLHPDLCIQQMARHLRPSGKALILVPNSYYLGTVFKVMRYGESDDQEDQLIVNMRLRREWERLLDENGLEVMGVEAYNGDHHIAWYFRREDPRVPGPFEASWRAVLDTFIKPFIPLDLCHCFIFTCRRSPSFE
jgi:SAM-dependent methyltransferase